MNQNRNIIILIAVLIVAAIAFVIFTRSPNNNVTTATTGSTSSQAAATDTPSAATGATTVITDTTATTATVGTTTTVTTTEVTAAPAVTATTPVTASVSPTVAAVPTLEPVAINAQPGGYLDRALQGEFQGKTVTMFGPFVDEDQVKFNNSIAQFEQQTGINIQYEGSKEFETTISVRVDGGDPPDIADFPQPGLLDSFAKDGKIIDVNSFLSADYLQQQYAQSWLDMATRQGPNGPVMAGVWQRFNGKSLVWYPKKSWDAAGYQIPQTWDDLMKLTDQIANDGDTAWCIGIESGAATGWPATDWIEDLMLRTTTPENYDKWVRGELKFDSPEVKHAVDLMSVIWFNDKYVYGGRASIVSTSFGDAPAPMFQNPPKCWMHRQGNFITSFFPASAKAGEDYDFFYFPPVDPAEGKPFLVAGDIMAAFSDRPEVLAVMEYFSTGASVRGWMAAGGVLSPHKDASLDWYGNDIDRRIAQMVNDATVLRFDGSDQMPAAVGTGSFWKAMTDYVSGTIDEETALKEIDASWPTNQ